MPMTFCWFVSFLYLLTVGMLNVLLTLKSPSNPAYDGTPWHVAGMMNEKIVACAFVYLSAVRRSVVHTF